MVAFSFQSMTPSNNALRFYHGFLENPYLVAGISQLNVYLPFKGFFQLPMFHTGGYPQKSPVAKQLFQEADPLHGSAAQSAVQRLSPECGGQYRHAQPGARLGKMRSRVIQWFSGDCYGN